MIRMIRRLIGDQRGATAVEYGLIVAMIVIAMIVGLSSVGGKTGGIWYNMANKVAAAENL